jgi:hypothetical protein
MNQLTVLLFSLLLKSTKWRQKFVSTFLRSCESASLPRAVRPPRVRPRLRTLPSTHPIIPPHLVVPRREPIPRHRLTQSLDPPRVSWTPPLPTPSATPLHVVSPSLLSSRLAPIVSSHLYAVSNVAMRVELQAAPARARAAPVILLLRHPRARQPRATLRRPRCGGSGGGLTHLRHREPPRRRAPLRRVPILPVR